MRTLHIELPDGRGYPIHIGTDILDDATLLPEVGNASFVCVISNETVAPLYLDRTLSLLSSARRVESIVVPDGEQYKTLETYASVFDSLTAFGAPRDTLLVALGGGVIGDLTGFAAATYMRGVSFTQIPTTLLAQVDASVGGKTGVNHIRGKNLIGAFHQPDSVIIDTRTLASLPEREYRAGLAEVVKYGLLHDSDLFSWLENNVEAILALDGDALNHLIYRSCEIKAEIVSADEREQGVRALLNLGHTFGHAIETATNYQQYLHGEAVAIGLVMAAELSAELGMCERDVSLRTARLLRRFSLPTKAPESMSPTRMLQLMQLDKKVLRNRLRFILLDGLGSATIATDVPSDVLKRQLEAHFENTVEP